MQGLHLTADLHDCRGDPALLTDADPLSDLCRRLTAAAGLTLVGEKWHTFEPFNGKPGGVTGMLLLAESHLAVHTWPERAGVTLDVYVCNFTADNSGRAEQLMDALVATFAPSRAQRERLLRGDAEGSCDGGELLLEALNPRAVYGYRFPTRLATRRTAHQTLELLESPELGRTLRLDGRFMTAEREEFFYHEALVHPAALAHPSPRRALIVGGGDGGAAEELLKHPSIEQVVIAELDAEVVRFAREHLAGIHRGALDDPRVRLHIGDGAAFVAATKERFDLVLLDLTDPETPAGPLYAEPFFRDVRRLLSPGGAMVLHLGAPFHESEQVRGIAAALAAVFREVHGYGLYIPLYGAYWALAVASDSLDPTRLNAEQAQTRLVQRHITDLRYYNAEVHGALFALPGFHRELMPLRAAGSPSLAA